MIQEMAKEIHVNGIEGESLRNHLNDAFREMYQKEFLIIAVNDSVASLLGAVAGKDVGQYGSLTGLIVGTGTNTCYLEQTHQIGKITSFESPTDLINMESGSFAQYIGGDFDRLLDINSELPGDHLFEKMVGGKYLGRIVHLTALAAQKEKIISQDYALTFLQDSTAKDINVLLKNKTDDNDFALVKQIANNFVKRASKLLAANLWATIKKQGNFEHPALISAEGTTFEKTYGFREAITNELAIHTNGLPIEWVSVPNAVVIGSALAASKYC
jgi:hexokinase